MQLFKGCPKMSHHSPIIYDFFRTVTASGNLQPLQKSISWIVRHVPQKRRTVKNKNWWEKYLHYNDYLNLYFALRSHDPGHRRHYLCWSFQQEVQVHHIEKKILDRFLSLDIYNSHIRPLGTALHELDSDESRF